MLKKERLLDFMDKHWFHMLSHLVAFPVTHDQEELHQLRVEIKKIRTVIWLVKKTEGKIPDRSEEILKAIFSAAGNVRSNYIKLIQLEQFLPEQSHESLRKKIKTEGSKLTSNSSRYVRIANRSYGRISQTINNIGKGKIEKLYKKQLNNIQKELENGPQDWHEARKRIKKLGYLQDLIPKKTRKQFNLDYDYLDDLEELIGGWHDLTINLPELQKKINRAAFAELQEQSKTAEKKISLAIKHFKRKVIKS